MTSNPPTSLPLPGNKGDAAPAPGRDQKWIATLVDKLVPVFQAQSGTSSAEAAMQTDSQGKTVSLPADKLRGHYSRMPQRS
ncbi:hypothetical protein PtB15_13B295 [Puccinia triticina]|nr:hypothetical protein PtB15_13B295 [Puccinia triticina]